MKNDNYETQAPARYFAVVAGSLEKYALQELLELGAEIHQEVPRGFYFSCSQATLYAILYTSRMVQRVLAPLLSFDCHSAKYLYQQAFKNVAWTGLFALHENFSIDCNVSNSFTRHSLFAGQVLKDAICDSFRQRYQERPSYSNKDAEIVFNLHIQNNRATIALDILGCSMHQRGYRKRTVEAPLQETLAAAIVQASAWQGEGVLCDPLCGSGTLVAEALMRICQIPAGYLRNNTRIRHLPGFDAQLWQATIDAANARILDLKKQLIYASDADIEAIEACKINLAALPGGTNVELKCIPFQKLDKEPGRTIICNPPYGVRLENPAGIQRLYRDLGDFLKQNCPASTAYILCGDKDLVKEIRLRAHWTKSFKNGDLDTKLAKILVR